MVVGVEGQILPIEVLIGWWGLASRGSSLVARFTFDFFFHCYFLFLPPPKFSQLQPATKSGRWRHTTSALRRTMVAHPTTITPSSGRAPADRRFSTDSSPIEEKSPWLCQHHQHGQRRPFQSIACDVSLHGLKEL